MLLAEETCSNSCQRMTQWLSKNNIKNPTEGFFIWYTCAMKELEQKRQDIGKGLSLEEKRDQEMADDYVARHPETVPLAENLKESPDVLKFKEVFDDFESRYPLKELESIKKIGLDEVLAHPMREPARKAFIEIWKQIRNVSFNSILDERYARIGKAIGVYDAANGCVDHDRYNNYRG